MTNKPHVVDFSKPVPLHWDESEWNGWRLEGLDLVYRPDPDSCIYPVSLECCTSSARVLDWIMQVANKKWATDACVAGLIHAFDDILWPQANLCGFGYDKRLTKKVVRTRILKRLSE